MLIFCAFFSTNFYLAIYLSEALLTLMLSEKHHLIEKSDSVWINCKFYSLKSKNLKVWNDIIHLTTRGIRALLRQNLSQVVNTDGQFQTFLANVGNDSEQLSTNRRLEKFFGKIMKRQNLKNLPNIPIEAKISKLYFVYWVTPG